MTGIYDKHGQAVTQPEFDRLERLFDRACEVMTRAQYDALDKPHKFQVPDYLSLLRSAADALESHPETRVWYERLVKRIDEATPDEA